MSAFQLKILAIVTMIIDHLGLFFFPHVLVFRMIGRLSFPLFAWLIANGAHHTHNGSKYLLRLALFAVVAQIPFLFANRLIDPTFAQLNVLFTLSIGLAAILLMQKIKDSQRRLWIIVLAAITAQFLQTDYGAFGVLVIALFYLFFNNFKYMVISQTMLFFAYALIGSQQPYSFAEPLGLVSLLFISLYNQKPGVKAKYLFYIFYPLQYIVIYLLLRPLL